MTVVIRELKRTEAIRHCKQDSNAYMRNCDAPDCVDLWIPYMYMVETHNNDYVTVISHINAETCGLFHSRFNYTDYSKIEII